MCRSSSLQLLAALDAAPLVPAVGFSFTETSYTTALLTKLNEQLLSYVSGFSTGLWPRSSKRSGIAPGPARRR